MASVPCRFLNHVKQDESQVAVEDIGPRAAIAEVQRRHDSSCPHNLTLIGDDDLKSATFSGCRVLDEPELRQ